MRAGVSEWLWRMLLSLFQETVIQEGDYIRLRIVGTRVDANDIVSRNMPLHNCLATW